MISALLTFVFALATLQNAAPAAPQEKGEIRGRVTDRETGLPLARVFVRISGPDAKEPVTTLTDERGVFRFVGLAPGRYSGSAQLAPFRGTHLIQMLTDADGRPIVLNKDEVRELSIALPRTLAMNVRVVDPWGEPLSELRVSVRPAGMQSSRGMSRMMEWQRTTDDNGRLRIFGLEPGHYVVCVEPNALGGFGTARSAHRRDRLLRTCYPNAANEGEAEPVRVDRSATGEREIRMRQGRTYTISGTVLDASGGTPVGSYAQLNQHSVNGGSSIGVQVEADGRFRIDNVHPGAYAVQISVGGPDRPEQRRDFEAGFVPVQVVDADVEGLLVVMKKGVDVAGRIRTEDPSVVLPAMGRAVFVVSTRLADDRLPGSGSNQYTYAGNDRTFTIKDSFGRRVVEVPNLPRGWFVKSIRYGATEVIDEPIEFKETRGDAPVLDVVLSNRGAVVTGRVTDDAGNAVPRAFVLMLRTRANGMAVIEGTAASATGAFKLGPARGGDYAIVAVPAGTPYPQAGEWDRLARLAAQGERVTLGEFDERLVDLRVVTERR
jgi:hypothetical protein